MSGRHLLPSKRSSATAVLMGAAVLVLRATQFVAGLLFTYALTYGVSAHNLALVQATALLAVVSAFAALLARAPFAGLWVSVLGASSLLLLSVPRILWPTCPQVANCVASGTQAATLVAVAVWCACVAWGARRLRLRARRARPA